MNHAQRKKLDMDLRLIRNSNFKKGEPDGFNKCFGTALYAMLDVSRYKRPGIMKLWDEMQAVDVIIKDSKNNSIKNYTDLYNTLYEEADIIVDEQTLKKAEQFVKEHKENSAQKQRVVRLQTMIAIYMATVQNLQAYKKTTEYANPIMNEKMNAALEAYKKGSATGFFRCLGMFLYAVLKKTNYKHSGLSRIYLRILEIDRAIEDPNCALTDELLYYALYEETDIICMQDFVPLAEQYANEYQITKTKKGYYEQVCTILDAYYNKTQI